MKFEVNTEKDDVSKSSFSFLLAFAILSLIIILANISFKLGKISRSNEINYLFLLLTIEKSSLNLIKISNLTNFNSKQKMWDFCREILK